MRPLLPLLLASALASPVSAGITTPPIETGVGPGQYDALINCVRNSKSKRLRGDRAFDGGHRFFFSSVRFIGPSAVEVTVYRDPSMPAQVRAVSDTWLGVDERLAAEVRDCAGEEVAVYRNRRAFAWNAKADAPPPRPRPAPEAMPSPGY